MTYPAETGPAEDGARIRSVVPNGAAQRAGLEAGELILLADGAVVRDVIDWMWMADDHWVALKVRDGEGTGRDVVVERGFDEPWGIDFDGVVFDGIRECENACAFCFVAQLPQGMRPSLYVRDDDFRLSFLYGNFVTLTNLDDADVARIIEQRLSPLHVSLHAVDEDVRRSLMCPTGNDRALEYIDRILAAGTRLHMQIVLVPGVNDGDVLQRTLAWLASREGVESVGVVPVGRTRLQTRIGDGFEDAASAGVVLDDLEGWRACMKADRGMTWVHAADELYLAAGRTVPGWDDYDGFPQFENGIGMVRAFVDETVGLLDGAPLPRGDTPVTLVTGTLFAPHLASLAPALSACGCAVRVLPVANELFGGNVNVAGLLAGADIARAVARDGGVGTYLVPDVTVNDDGLFLDDMTLAMVAQAAGRDVRLVSCDAAGLVSALRELSTAISG